MPDDLRSHAAPLELDLRGLKCPLPALRTRKALARLGADERLRVAATDPMSAIDIPHAAACAGWRVVAREKRGEALVFTIAR